MAHVIWTPAAEKSSPTAPLWHRHHRNRGSLTTKIGHEKLPPSQKTSVDQTSRLSAYLMVIQWLTAYGCNILVIINGCSILLFCSFFRCCPTMSCLRQSTCALVCPHLVRLSNFTDSCTSDERALSAKRNCWKLGGKKGKKKGKQGLRTERTTWSTKVVQNDWTLVKSQRAQAHCQEKNRWPTSAPIFSCFTASIIHNRSHSSIGESSCVVCPQWSIWFSAYLQYSDTKSLSIEEAQSKIICFRRFHLFSPLAASKISAQMNVFHSWIGWTLLANAKTKSGDRSP